MAILAQAGAAEAADAALRDKASVLADEVSFHDTVDGYLATNPDLTIECAVHQVVREVVPQVLRAQE